MHSVTESKLVEHLNERIKELTCLYEISRVASEPVTNLDATIRSILHIVARAWKHQDYAVAEIIFNGKNIAAGNIPDKSVFQSEPVIADGEHVGMVRVHYPADRFSYNDFLPEEKQLLKKVASEFAIILERHFRQAKEEALKRSAERSDRLGILGEITAGIAHELNTPLGNILGFAQLIQESKASEQVIRDAGKIENSAIYAREVVKKLMFFSCEMPQQMEIRRLNPMVEEAIQLLKPTLHNAGIASEFIPDTADPALQADPIQITQVVFNLIINAIHASPANSTITIRTESDQRDVRIIIADQGKGIPKEIQDRIFEPFFTSRPVGEGTGLGLSVVHGIVKSHKGKIFFSTAENKGTTFSVILPRKI